MLWLSLSALILPAFSATTTLDEFSGRGFQYFDRNDRVETVQRLCRDLKRTYALWELKKELAGVDSEEHCKTLIATEIAINDPTDRVEQAKANLTFFDRVKKFGAGFKDTHFSIRTTGPRSPIVLPLTIRKVDGKYLVTGRSKKLLQYIAQTTGDDSIANISIGDELLEFNGNPVKSEVATLIPYQSEGTDLGAEAGAIAAMLFRNYAYPVNPVATLTLKSTADQTVRKFEMSWLYSDPKRADEKVYFGAMGFKNVMDLKYQYDPNEHEWNAIGLFDEDYLPAIDMGKNLSGVREYMGTEDGELTIRKGMYVSGGKAYGVLQILAFHEAKVQATNATSEEAFLNVIRNAIKEFKSMSVPLILDLRENGGGISGYPAKVLSMLTPKDKVYPGRTRAFRVTTYIRSMLENTPENIRDVLGREATEDVTDQEVIALLDEAIANRSRYTQAFSSGDIKHDPAVDGFDAPIVALISPECVSACDAMSTLLKSSGRATIIGTNTSATGAGYNTNGGYKSVWTDGLQIFQTSIPNYLFGIPGGSVGQMRFPGQANTLCTENRPTIADVRYETTLDDVQNGDRGWLQKAVEVLNK